MSDEGYQIRDVAALEAAVGKPMEFLGEKIEPELNEAMKAFIAASSLAMVSTIDANGHVDVSPKGAPVGGSMSAGAPYHVKPPTRPRVAESRSAALAKSPNKTTPKYLLYYLQITY